MKLARLCTSLEVKAASSSHAGRALVTKISLIVKEFEVVGGS